MREDFLERDGQDACCPGVAFPPDPLDPEPEWQATAHLLLEQSRAPGVMQCPK